MQEEQPKQRACITYKETPFEGKPVNCKRVLGPVASPEEAHKQFWKEPVWPAETKRIEILQTSWLED